MINYISYISCLNKETLCYGKSTIRRGERGKGKYEPLWGPEIKYLEHQGSLIRLHEKVINNDYYMALSHKDWELPNARI